MDGVEGLVRDPLLEEDDGVTLLDPKVRHAGLVCGGEHPGQARTVHVHGQHVPGRNSAAYAMAAWP